jgi:type VI protein secretion system component Hcp
MSAPSTHSDTSSISPRQSLRAPAAAAVPGKTTASPLIVDLAATPGLADLLTREASGQHIPSVTFTVQKPGGSPFDFETITLTNATILSYEEKAGFATRVALGYDKVEVEQIEQNANGSPGTLHTFTFDLRTNGGTLASPPADALVPTAREPAFPQRRASPAVRRTHHVGAFDARVQAIWPRRSQRARGRQRCRENDALALS